MSPEPLFSPADLRRLDRLALRTRRAIRGEWAGERKSRRAGTGGEFADHRTYVHGDDLRYVDWNVYFRLGDLVVKRFESEEDVRVLLAVDRSPSMGEAKAREARRLAGAIGHVALRRRDAVALAWLPLVPERPVEVFRGAARIPAFFQRLLDTPAAGPTAHAKDLERILSASPRRGPAILVSDFFDPAGAVTGLARLSAHGYETTALHVVDPLDVDLPAGESVRCIDRETGETLDLDVTESLRDSLFAAWRRRADRLRSWCVAREIGWQRIDVGRPFWDVVQEMIRSRGILAS